MFINDVGSKLTSQEEQRRILTERRHRRPDCDKCSVRIYFSQNIKFQELKFHHAQENYTTYTDLLSLIDSESVPATLGTTINGGLNSISQL